MSANDSISGILETSLYAADLVAADTFYGGVLGLEKILAVPGRQLVFRCGQGVLLIFDPKRAEQEQVVINGGAIPFHGAHGAGHVAFQVAESQLQDWRERFRVAAVQIESEVSWPNGAHSIYFRDPAGNCLELATPGIWELPGRLQSAVRSEKG
jgi:catechol 2,3-dioxygenase-like lactoylglutathione lyase family enzyme